MAREKVSFRKKVLESLREFLSQAILFPVPRAMKNKKGEGRYGFKLERQVPLHGFFYSKLPVIL